MNMFLFRFTVSVLTLVEPQFFSSFGRIRCICALESLVFVDTFKIRSNVIFLLFNAFARRDLIPPTVDG